MVRWKLWYARACGSYFCRPRVQELRTAAGDTSPTPAPAPPARAASDAPAPPVPNGGPTRAERELGLALYRLRVERGLSLRALAKLLGYSAHSVFADVEKARRLPPESMVRSYERCFEVAPDSLMSLRQEALRERAVLLTDRFAALSAECPQSPPVVTAPSAPPAPSAALPALPPEAGPLGSLRLLGLAWWWARRILRAEPWVRVGRERLPRRRA